MGNSKEEMSLKEERIRKTAVSYYFRNDIRKAITDFAKNREVVPRYFEGFGKRPDAVQFESDILQMVKRGATSFHCSEELWKDPLQLATGLSTEQFNEMRLGWDLLIDVDSKWLDYSKISAELLIKALEYNGIKNIGVKFSGSKGFHIIVPWQAFPKQVQGIETKKMFPEWPRAICNYLNSLIKSELIERITDLNTKNRKEYVKDFEAPEKVMPDIVLVSPRHLFRMPYSLHEKTALASIVIDKDKISEFDIMDASALKAVPKNFIPDAVEGEATKLLLHALDYKPPQSSYQKDSAPQSQQKREYKEIVIKDLTSELYPPSIKQILNGMKSDGRKRALFILLNFFRSLNMENEKIEAIITEWNNKNYQPLHASYLSSQFQWHFKTTPKLPPNFDKPHYKEIGITPDESELRTKNPVSYVIRRNFSKSQTKPRKNRKISENSKNPA